MNNFFAELECPTLFNKTIRQVAIIFNIFEVIFLINTYHAVQ